MEHIMQGLGTTILPTNLTRKLTINGITKAYPVYRIRLDQLYYNDQNDRIATWINQYKTEKGEESLLELSREAYNTVIESFIVESNEAAIEKTQMNIALVKQREPGVVLSDGRVIDGNRRFTCLRRLAKNDPEYNWFESAILDVDINSGKKQIKMLELAIQHGEEKKVDYSPIDRLVGVYQDVIETKLLTVEEYATSTNETVFEVKKRIESAMLLIDFLEYIRLPKQYYVARDYQVVSAISDMQSLLRKCATIEMQTKVKNAIFANIMMKTIGDSRKFIRNLDAMMSNGFFNTYLKEQEKIEEQIQAELDQADLKTKKDLDRFVIAHEDIAELMQVAADQSLLKAKRRETRNRPSQIVSKSISMLRDVDTNIFEKLNEEEKDNLVSQLDRLSTVVKTFETIIVPEKESSPAVNSDKPSSNIIIKKISTQPVAQKKYYIGKYHLDEPALMVNNSKPITNLSTSIEIEAIGRTSDVEQPFTGKAFFIAADNSILSDIKELNVKPNERQRILFVLTSQASTQGECYLAIQSNKDASEELQLLIPFSMKMSFVSEFDF